MKNLWFGGDNLTERDVFQVINIEVHIILQTRAVM